MATTDETLVLETRTERGTTTAHALRRIGKIPAILFGHGSEPLKVATNAKAFDDLLHAGGRTHLVNVTIDGGKRDTVLVREVQRDPVSRRVLHVDLQRVGATETITQTVPIVTVGVAEGVKNSGGVMDVLAHAVEISGPANALPAHLEVDVTNLGIHDRLTAGDVKLPPKFSLVTEAATNLITIEPSRVEQEAAATEPAPTPEETPTVAEAEGSAE